MRSDAGLPLVGEVLANKYRVVRPLGHGGVGWVFEAEHLKLRTRVALKVLLPQMREHPEMIERFEREARAMAALQSPHVTRVTDVDACADGTPFLVMELLQGHDLQRELKARGPLPIHEAVGWVREACVGLAAVHRAGIVHRDLKPANLFLADDERGRTLKIMDFGVSKVAGDFDVTVTTTSLGTPAYMAPEQVRSAKHIDGRADLWSLGVILHRLLTGQLPFRGDSSTAIAIAIASDPPQPIREVRADVPPGLAAVLERALQKDPAHRFATAMELADALAPFAQPQPLEIAPAIAASSIALERRKRPVWPFAVAGAVVLAALATFFIVRAPSHADTSEPAHAASVHAPVAPSTTSAPPPSAAEPTAPEPAVAEPSASVVESPKPKPIAKPAAKEPPKEAPKEAPKGAPKPPPKPTSAPTMPVLL